MITLLLINGIINISISRIFRHVFHSEPNSIIQKLMLFLVDISDFLQTPIHHNIIYSLTNNYNFIIVRIEKRIKRRCSKISNQTMMSSPFKVSFRKLWTELKKASSAC